jgi:transcriptional regulator with PAS, ATPase and Fis domain
MEKRVQQRRTGHDCPEGSALKGEAGAGLSHRKSVAGFIGVSPLFMAARECIQRISETDATVLLEGETGTGKELAARVIHYEGARRAGPFIPVNCGAIPDSLLESELFGHCAGAFTDARKAASGVLMLANCGTLFLDEVDSLSLRAQVVLLRFLQERTIRPLGSGTERHVDTRVISASNRSLEKLVTQGGFRQDLFYRLNVMHVELPPLRSRVEDIELFADRFLTELSRRYGVCKPLLTRQSLHWLREQSWPGNVRQLENFMEREFLLSRGTSVLSVSPLSGEAARRSEPVPTQQAWNYQQAKARSVEEFDRDFLSKLMSFTQGNVAMAARVTSKERRDLRRLLQKYDISPQTFRRARQ